MNESNNPLFGGEDNSAYVNENTSVPFGEDAKEEASVVAEEEAPATETSFCDDTISAGAPSAEEPVLTPEAAEFIPESSAEEASEAVEEIPADTPDELATAYEAPAEINAYEATESNLYSSDNFTDNFSEDFSSPAPAAEEVPVAESSAFNPYAPKSPEATSNNIPLQNDAQNAPQAPVNNQINPSYNQQLNHNYSQQGAPQQPYGNSYSPHQAPTPKNNKNGKIILFSIIGICIFVGLIAIVSSFFGGNDNKTELSTTESTTSVSIDPATSTTAPADTSNAPMSTTQSFDQGINSIWVAEKVRPSVVGVLAYKQGELAGEGSGVLMSESIAENCTYVVTCAHVINEPRCEFVILLLDGTVYEAEVVALDERTDIGVLKIKKTGLPLAEFGDSSSLKIGEPIYAIGNPGGSEYFGSITNGIVASIDRSISSTYTMTCIQHNAAINPGNSGGALVNTAGQVIGINSSKIARTDFEGMGFAVPSSIFTPVVDALIKHGYVPNRPELGIKYASVSDYQLYSLIVSIKGLPRESVIIAEIPEGSALAGTQAQVGDLIIAVNGKDMDSSDVLLDLIDTGAVGDSLTLTLCRVQDRSYETSTFDVTVQLVEDKGSITTTTQAATLPQQDGYYGNFEDFFGDFFGW